MPHEDHGRAAWAAQLVVAWLAMLGLFVASLQAEPTAEESDVVQTTYQRALAPEPSGKVAPRPRLLVEERESLEPAPSLREAAPLADGSAGAVVDSSPTGDLPGEPGSLPGPVFGHRVKSLFGLHRAPAGCVERCGERPTWFTHPISAGVYLGAIQGSPISQDWLGQMEGTIGGLRLSWDADRYWGYEARYALGSTLLYDSPSAIAVRTARDNLNGLGPNDPNRYEFAPDRFATHTLLDGNLLLYPWGDTRWRPFFSVGLGWAQLTYEDILGVGYIINHMTVPVGVGVKYLYSDRLALRIDCTDTVILSGMAGINTLHDLTLTGGVEWRFGGGSRRAYWPWNVGSH